MPRIGYDEYMRSGKWSAKRLERFKYDNYKCRTCGSSENLECHHVSYERFGNELLEDLITLCKYCHDAITNSIRERRYENSEIKLLNIEKEEVFYEENESEIDWSSPTDLSQQSGSRSIELLFKGDEEDIWKTK